MMLVQWGSMPPCNQVELLRQVMGTKQILMGRYAHAQRWEFQWLVYPRTECNHLLGPITLNQHPVINVPTFNIYINCRTMQLIRPSPQHNMVDSHSTPSCSGMVVFPGTLSPTFQKESILHFDIHYIIQTPTSIGFSKLTFDMLCVAEGGSLPPPMFLLVASGVRSMTVSEDCTSRSSRSVVEAHDDGILPVVLL